MAEKLDLDALRRIVGVAVAATEYRHQILAALDRLAALESASNAGGAVALTTNAEYMAGYRDGFGSGYGEALANAAVYVQDHCEDGDEQSEVIRKLKRPDTHPAPASKEPGADERDMALRWATQLAESIWRKHYANEAPEWKPMSYLVGVISQIDNMSTGLTRAALATAQTEQREADYALAYKHGWINCAKWADRVDMISDIGSAAYDRDLAAAAERHGFLAAAPAKGV